MFELSRNFHVNQVVMNSFSCWGKNETVEVEWIRNINMAKLNLSGKDLRGIGYPESPVISLAMDVMEKNYKRNSKEHALGLLKAVLARPGEYAEDEILGKIARALIEREERAAAKAAATVDLRITGIPYNIFGAEFIEDVSVPSLCNGADEQCGTFTRFHRRRPDA